MKKNLVLFICVISLMLGCATTHKYKPIKSFEYQIDYIDSKDMQKMKTGKFVVLGRKNKKDNYKIYKIGDSYEEVKADYYNVYNNIVIWINGKVVSPYFNIPEIGQGQYDEERKTFLCLKTESRQPPGDYTLPNPCWSPITKSINDAFFEFLSPQGDREFVIDRIEVIKAIEQSKIFEKINVTQKTLNNKYKYSYLKVISDDGKAIVKKINGVHPSGHGNIIQIKPGIYSLELVSMVNPKAHGAQKHITKKTRNITFKPGYFYFTKMECGIAMVGIVCPPEIYFRHCREAEVQCSTMKSNK